MKTIFVATDFSPASRNAFAYSLEMANAFDAEVILFHAFQLVSIPSLEASLVISLEETEQIIQTRLKDEVKEVPNPHGVPVQIAYEEGPVVTRILERATREHANLLIGGMKHSGKFFRRLFGSTVTDLVKESIIPMIVVPEGVKFTAPKKIALASDNMPETDFHTVDTLQEIGVQFGARVFIVRVISDQFEEAYELLDRPTKFIRLSRTLDTSYNYTKNKHISEALNEFVDERGIDLLAMVPHKHRLAESWLYASQTKAMVFKSHVPLLILPEKLIALTDPSEAFETALK